MKRIFVCLFVVFSLMLTPMAHAAGVNCPDTGCTIADQFSKKQEDGKLSDTGHHCCHHQVAPFLGSISVSLISAPADPVLTPDGSLASIIVGPLLEPPSPA